MWMAPFFGQLQAATSNGGKHYCKDISTNWSCHGLLLVRSYFMQKLRVKKQYHCHGKIVN